MIRPGKKIAFEYTVFLEDGAKIDTNVGDNPLVFIQGENQVFPALEQALLRLDIGTSKKIPLSPDEAYGHILNEGFREIQIEMLPSQYRYVGAIVEAKDSTGDLYPIRVHRLSDDTATLNFNHPLAGKTLLFDVKILKID